ncbi:MAG: hypothetical protein R3F59_25800 [Myxococcota bacterium]
MLVAVALVAHAGDAEHGALLAGLAGCSACHTEELPSGELGAPYAGGHAIETSFGTFYGSNLTPDPEHGIGAWTEADFVRARRRGRAPDGHRYWPAFPFADFTHLTDADLGDLWAFLRTLPPDPRPNTPHEDTPAGWKRWGWRVVAFHPARPLPPVDPALARGQYLVEAVGHCGGCHTERNGLGVPRRDAHLAGSDQEPHGGPNLTPSADGLGSWTTSDFETLFTLGMLPDGDFAGGGMRHVIRDGTALLPEADRDAIIRYPQAPPPLP